MTNRGRAAITVVIVAILAGALAAATTTVEANATASDPWHDAGYTPSPGRWQPYVLAPTSHDVQPSTVTADARGGSIQGNPADVLASKGSVRLTSTGDRTTSPLLTFDFGKEVGGKIQVHVVSSSATAPKLHVCFSESQRYMALHPQDNNGEAAQAPGCDTANIWNGYPGIAYTYDSDSHLLSFDPADLPTTVTDTQLRGGFRYATLFLDGAGSVTIDRVALQFGAVPSQSNPADYRGYFLSSDNTLNKIWYAGAYTVQMDTWPSDTAKSWPYQQGEADHADAQVPHANPNQEVIFDGAKRDRIVWQGDLAVQAPVTYLSTDDITAVDNSLSSLAAQQLPDGYMPAESLVGQHNRDEMRTYGEYVTWFINNEYEHWLYTGDRGYLDQWWSALTKATDWLESVRNQDPQGLIAFGSVGSCGHYGYSDCGHETYVNALYARNLDQMAALARALGDDAQATTYADRAAALKRAINDQLWDDQTGAYRLSREIPNAYPQDANATAILTGVASPDQARRAMTYLRRTSWSRFGALTVAPATPNASIHPFYEPLPSGFEASARLQLTGPTGVAQLSGLDLMRTFWGYQLSQDPNSTWPEKLDLNGQPGIAQFTSLAHGWAAAPTEILTNQVLGVTPTGAGFSGYDVVPHPGDLTWAEGRVPTPHGDITASWRATESGFVLRASAPDGTTGRLAVPTDGVPNSVTLDGQPVWDGQHALGGADATSDGSYVYINGVPAGQHQLVATRITPVSTTADVVVAPDQQTTTPGALVHIAATVSGRAAHTLSGTLHADVPSGWIVQPADTAIRLTSDGHPVSTTVDLYIQVPDDAGSGHIAVPVTFTTDDGVTARDTATVTLSTTEILYGFEDGTQGWQAGNNVTSVAKVSSFADGPGHCQDGTGCLEATSAVAPADAVRTVHVDPSSALDLSQATTFLASIDCYGGAPGATGYEAVVTLTGAGGQTMTKTLTISNDTWNQLSVDISGWAPRSAISQVEIGFHAVGSSTAWTSRFQIDSVGWKN